MRPSLKIVQLITVASPEGPVYKLVVEEEQANAAR